MALIRYLGHSGFEIDFEGTKVYIDLYTGSDGKAKVKLPVDVSKIKKADVFLITHEHHDHCDPIVGELADRTSANVIGPKPSLARLKMNERLKVDVRVGDRFEVKGVDIEVVKAVHPQSAYPVGYILRKNGKSIYHAGDTYQYSGMSSNQADVAMLPIGGTYTMDPISAHNAVKEIRPKYVIPMHYNTFENIRQEIDEFTKDLGSVKPIVLRVGEDWKF